MSNKVSCHSSVFVTLIFKASKKEVLQDLCNLQANNDDATTFTIVAKHESNSFIYPNTALNLN